MSNTIETLTDRVRGRVITASDPDYDDVRVVYNAMHDRKPGAIIQCMDSADVMTAVAVPYRLEASRKSCGRWRPRGPTGRPST